MIAALMMRFLLNLYVIHEESRESRPLVLTIPSQGKANVGSDESLSWDVEPAPRHIIVNRPTRHGEVASCHALTIE